MRLYLRAAEYSPFFWESGLYKQKIQQIFLLEKLVSNSPVDLIQLINTDSKVRSGADREGDLRRAPWDSYVKSFHTACKSLLYKDAQSYKKGTILLCYWIFW